MNKQRAVISVDAVFPCCTTSKVLSRNRNKPLMTDSHGIMMAILFNDFRAFVPMAAINFWAEINRPGFPHERLNFLVRR